MTFYFLMMRVEMTRMVGTAGVVALRETRPLCRHLTRQCDVAFYGVDNFMDL